MTTAQTEIPCPETHGALPTLQPTHHWKALHPYFRRMRSKDCCPPRKPLKKIFWSWIGAFTGIFLIAWLGQCVSLHYGAEAFFLLGSFGASAVLIYGAPLAEFSQPRNLIGGHVISALIGVSIHQLLPDPSSFSLAAALAVSLSIFSMHMSRTLHPPGGATALIAVTGGVQVQRLGYLYVLCPVLLGATILLVVALAINNLSTNPKRHYPVYWC